RLDIDIRAERANVFDAAVRCAVDFEYVDVVAGGNALADFALIARVAVDGIRAVERLRQNPGHRRFADAASAGEQIRMRDAVRGDGIAKSLRDHLLPNDLAKGLGPKPAGQDGVV